MDRRTISGFSNPAVKALRALRDKKHRKREGRFLVEGLRRYGFHAEADRVAYRWLSMVMASIPDR